MVVAETVDNNPEVSVIVPARNEEACLGRCLESLVRQQDVNFEVLVVDDGSTDRTREIASSFSGVRVIEAPPLPPGWSGKSNAIAAGADQARGQWLLFTDADTVHLPGSLARSLAEAKRHGASLLSYSPEQEVHGLWEKAVMPVIFAELASVFRPAEVSDPSFPTAAANGQYLLISREGYDAVGGFTAFATDLLEDVALARALKKSGRRIHFRLGPDAVRARMYRSFAQLREGWTKNLVLLFPAAGRLAVVRLAEFCAIVLAVIFTVLAGTSGSIALASIAGLGTAGLYGLFLRRIRKAHFSWDANLLAIFGLPLFAYLLLRSRLSYGKGSVVWKGRRYETSHQKGKQQWAGRPLHSRRDADATSGRSWSI